MTDHRPSALDGGRFPIARGWKMVLLASLGGGLEFYDFVICGIFAQFIGETFFPSDNAMISLMMSYGLFAAGYLARPVGGIVLGHIGDRYGRRRVFVASVILMSLSTLAIGLLPGYREWGAWAPLTLILLRLIQGACLGGELPGAVTYVVETQRARAGLACGIVYAFANSGALAATMINWLLQTHYSPAKMAEFGWRVAFVLGGMLGLLSFWLRRSLRETPAFNHAHIVRTPIREVLTKHRWAVAVGIGCAASSAGFTGLLFAHMQGYLTRVLNYDGPRVATALNVALLVMTLTMIIGGWLADRVPRELILRFCTGALMLLAIPVYVRLATDPASLGAMLLVIVPIGAIINGAFPSIIADLFPTQVRYTGVGVAVNISYTVLGGTAPLAATALIGFSGWAAAPAILLTLCAALGFTASYALRGCAGQLGLANALQKVSR